MIAPVFLCAQPLSNKKEFTHQDTLRGSVTPERAWWDVLKYDISVTPDYESKTIKGKVIIEFKAVKNGSILQLDLQEPLIIDSIFEISGYPNERTVKQTKLNFTNEGNAHF